MTLPKGHLSYSQLSLFADCPASWRAVNLDGMRGSSNRPMRLGAGIHDLIARHLSGMAGEEAQVLAAHDLSPAQARTAMDIYVNWLATWADTAEGVLPEQIEDTLEFDVPTKPAVRFQARLDFWRENEGIPTIYDWKSSQNLPGDGAVADLSGEVWSQLLTYAVGFRQQRVKADRYGLRLVLVRYNVTHEQTVDGEAIDQQEQALVASCQAVLLAVQSGKFSARPGRACSTCPIQQECKLAAPLDPDPAALARAWLYHKEQAKAHEEALRDLAEYDALALEDETGVVIGYKPTTRSEMQTRQVDRVKQVLVELESGEQAWAVAVREETLSTRFGVYETKKAAVAGARTQ
jgi:hypothetical protein